MLFIAINEYLIKKRELKLFLMTVSSFNSLIENLIIIPLVLNLKSE